VGGGGGGGGGGGVAVSVQEPLQRFALVVDRHSNLSTANQFILIILKKNNLSVSCAGLCALCCCALAALWISTFLQKII
jgi:hypothetical protein